MYNAIMSEVLFFFVELEYSCVEDWLQFGSSCYKFSLETTTHSSAKQWCKTEDANVELVSVESTEESDFVSNNDQIEAIKWFGAINCRSVPVVNLISAVNSLTATLK